MKVAKSASGLRLKSEMCSHTASGGWITLRYTDSLVVYTNAVLVVYYRVHCQCSGGIHHCGYTVLLVQCTNVTLHIL